MQKIINKVYYHTLQQIILRVDDMLNDQVEKVKKKILQLIYGLNNE